MLDSVEFFATSIVNDSLFSKLASLQYSSTGTRRICLHQNEESPLHIMLVQAAHGNKFPRHFHNDSDEVTVVLRGRLKIDLWVTGIHNPPTTHLLDPTTSSQVCFLSKGCPHVTEPLTSDVIYLEVKLGPFSKEALVLY